METEKELIEKFNVFMFSMSEEFDALEAEFSKNGYPFDYSVSSLFSLEEYVLQNVVSVDSLAGSRAASYLGEVARKLFGGKWELYIENPSMLYYGLPVIAGFSPHGVVFCPHEVLGCFILRKKNGMLSQAVLSNSAEK